MTEKASILTLRILATACGRRNQFLLRGRLVDGRHLGCGGLRSSSRRNAKSDPRRRVLRNADSLGELVDTSDWYLGACFSGAR